MAFPTFVAAATETQTTLNGASPVSISVPSATAGNKLICILGTNVGWAGFSGASGWTTKKALIHSTSGGELLILERTATGSDTLSIQWNTASNTIAFVIEIQNAHTDTLEVSTGAEGTSTTPDPDTITPSWGSDNNLIIAAAFEDRGSGNPFTVFPYADNNQQQHSGSTGSNHVTIAICSDELTGTSENPGTFTCSNWPWVAVTVAVRPEAAASSTYGGTPHSDKPRSFVASPLSSYTEILSEPETLPLLVTPHSDAPLPLPPGKGLITQYHEEPVVVLPDLLQQPPVRVDGHLPRQSFLTQYHEEPAAAPNFVVPSAVQVGALPPGKTFFTEYQTPPPPPVIPDIAFVRPPDPIARPLPPNVSSTFTTVRNQPKQAQVRRGLYDDFGWYHQKEVSQMEPWGNFRGGLNLTIPHGAWTPIQLTTVYGEGGASGTADPWGMIRLARGMVQIVRSGYYVVVLNMDWGAPLSAGVRILTVAGRIEHYNQDGLNTRIVELESQSPGPSGGLEVFLTVVSHATPFAEGTYLQPEVYLITDTGGSRLLETHSFSVYRVHNQGDDTTFRGNWNF